MEPRTLAFGGARGSQNHRGGAGVGRAADQSEGRRQASKSGMVTRVLLVDGVPLLRLGLRALISGEADLEVAGEAERARQCFALLHDRQPDVVLFDGSLPDGTPSEREREVFELLVRGIDNETIAARLFISSATVSTHRERILHKLGVHSLAGLVRWAARHGLQPLLAAE